MVGDLFFVLFFQKFDNYIKGIVHLYIEFLDKLTPLILHVTYQLIQIFITFDRTDISFFKQVHK